MTTDFNNLLKNIKAVIFDMDGTMVNNMPFHKIAWKKFCKRYGLNLTDKEFKEKISGKKNDQIFEIMFRGKLSKEEKARKIEEKESLYRNIYQDYIKEVPGLRKLLKQLKKRNLKLAIATSAPKKNRDIVLEALGCKNEFDLIRGDEDIEKGKPDPEIFLKTASELGVSHKDCLVFEDSPPGVEAAKKAGMKVIGILTTHKSDELKLADLSVSDFNQLQLI